jgi:ElaB/YqjD/DUF883 family membrane-anchored ribosome-binding protein
MPDTIQSGRLGTLVRSNGSDPAHVRADLARSRHRFEEAADAVRQDLEALRALTQWKTILRSRPFIGLVVAVAAGLALGIFLAARRDD